MDYMTLKEASKNLGSNTPLDKLLLFCRTYPRSGKNGNRLAYPEECNKAIRRTKKSCRAIRRGTS